MTGWIGEASTLSYGCGWRWQPFLMFWRSLGITLSYFLSLLPHVPSSCGGWCILSSSIIGLLSLHKLLQVLYYIFYDSDWFNDWSQHGESFRNPLTIEQYVYFIWVDVVPSAETAHSVSLCCAISCVLHSAEISIETHFFLRRTYLSQCEAHHELSGESTPLFREQQWCRPLISSLQSRGWRSTRISLRNIDAMFDLRHTVTGAGISK